MWITLRTASDFYSNFITDAYSKKATESKSQINQLLNQSPKDIAQTNKPLISYQYTLLLPPIISLLGSSLHFFILMPELIYMPGISC
jgi:hypothetical protein